MQFSKEAQSGSRKISTTIKAFDLGVVPTTRITMQGSDSRITAAGTGLLPDSGNYNHPFLQVLASVPVPELIDPGHFMMMMLVSSTVRQAITTGCLHAEVKAKRGATTQAVMHGLGQMKTRVKFIALDFSAVSIGPAGAAMLKQLIVYWPLKRLDLSWNNIMHTGVENIAAGLVKLTALAQLNLNHNSIRNEGAEKLGAVIGQCTSLTDLDVAYNTVDDEAMDSLIRGLSGCNLLTRLDVRGNKINYASMEALKSVVGQLTALSVLELNNTDITDHQVPGLGMVLRCSKSLTCLGLSHNEIRSAGAEKLAAELRNCPSLVDLNLRQNYTGYEGATSLVKVLGVCTSLASLNLYKNGLGARQKQMVLELATSYSCCEVHV